MSRLQSKDDFKAQEILSDAFSEDPLLTWLSTNPKFIPALFSLLVPLYRKQGLALISDDKSGVALWMPPNKELKMQFYSLVKFLHICAKIGLISTLRLSHLSKESEKHKPKKPFYYLFSIGISKKTKGKGVGSLLMKEALAKCDEESCLAYLENSNENNLPFYKKHGFETVKEVQLKNGGPSIWFMVRQPKKCT